MLGLLSEDLTTLTNVDSSNLSTRELELIKVWEAETWLPEKSLVEQPFVMTSRDYLYQVLMVENISKSKLGQIDDYDSKLNPTKQKVDRLQNSKVVINQVNMDNEDLSRSETSATTQNPVYKLTLQDKLGKIFYAISSKNIPWIGVCMLGSKLIIKKGSSFCRGVFIIDSSSCTFLGGVNRVWNENKELKLNNYLDSKLKMDANEKVTAKSNNKKRKK